MRQTNIGKKLPNMASVSLPKNRSWSWIIFVSSTLNRYINTLRRNQKNKVEYHDY